MHMYHFIIKSYYLWKFVIVIVFFTQYSENVSNKCNFVWDYNENINEYLLIIQIWTLESNSFIYWMQISSSCSINPLEWLFMHIRVNQIVEMPTIAIYCRLDQSSYADDCGLNRPCNRIWLHSFWRIIYAAGLLIRRKILTACSTGAVLMISKQYNSALSGSYALLYLLNAAFTSKNWHCIYFIFTWHE